ncbi:MAG TPA: carboxypeptidase-like regulatory domain-containing protein [Thermoanaerobaculia bacterium]|nr:carboxypeptidase-like regulatory domain-containing protein [Thermoanaerobaculia bacterium]
MRRFSAIAFACAILGSSSTARPDSLPLPAALNVLGFVTAAARPVEHALVIALNLNTLEASQTFSGADGGFSLRALPAAVYRIITVKPGFAPMTTMIVPTQKDYHLAIRLDGGKRTASDTNQEIWELRGSLPPDILRELDMAMAQPVVMASNDYQIPRIKGEMVSMTGVGDQSSNPGFAQTALGVQSRIGDRWQLGFRGDIHRVDDPSDGSPFGNAIAESSGMQMELRSSATDAYRVGSTKSWWLYRNVPAAQQQADISSNNVEWQHGDARLQVRYLEQQNLFAGNPGSNLIEVAGNTTVLQTQRTDVGVTLRVSQESLHNAANATFRTADLTANANWELIPSVIVRYGMSSRMGLYGAEWAPRTGAEWKLSKDASFVVSGMYKVYDPDRQNILPSIVMWSDESNVLPRYAYSFGFVSGDDKNSKFSAIATVSAADSPLRIVFTDGFEQFWDGLYIDTGDVRRDLRLAYRRELGRTFLIDISSSAGTATPAVGTIGENKVYLTSDVQSTYYPSGTTLAVSYRQLHQPLPAGTAEYRSERMNVRVAQDLHLPLDLKVLLGIEVARAVNSPFMLDALETDGTTRKYIGGLAVNF